MYEDFLEIGVEEKHKRFDPKVGMIMQHVAPWNGGSGGYHTRISGDLHSPTENSAFADHVFFLRKEEYYEEAKSVLWGLIKYQDNREDSKTYGLWPYYIEEDCDHMIAPDYNMADFNAKHFAYILKRRSDCLDDELRAALSESLMKAAICSIRRNVSPDYTNISLMSLNTIINAGEISGNKEFLERGKERLRKVHEYNTFCGCFSEYNSSTYSPLAIEEISMMLELFEDEECVKMAKNLNVIAWEMLLSHYHRNLKQVSPPQMRCYHNFEGSKLEEMIYLGTKGAFGSIDKANPKYPAMLQIPPVCPKEVVEKYLKKPFEPTFIDQTFYKKNNFRTPDEDTVIIRNIDSPDLKAFTYMAEEYAMGAFEKTDMWTQRRSSMVYWGEGQQATCMFLRCMNYDYDYCSGMVYTNQYRNVMLSHTGFVTDRGDFHYILDKTKDGLLTTKKLFYKFEFDGDCDNIKVEQNGGRFTVKDKGITIEINITEAVFDGKPMKLCYNETDKCIEAVCFGTERTIDFKNLKSDCHMVFTLAVNTDCPEPVTAKDESEQLLKSELTVDGKTLTLCSPYIPVGYDSAIEKTKTEGRE